MQCLYSALQMFFSISLFQTFGPCITTVLGKNGTKYDLLALLVSYIQSLNAKTFAKLPMILCVELKYGKVEIIYTSQFY